MGSSSALQNLSSATYLPRRIPSTSKPPTFTRRMPCFSNAASSCLASMGREPTRLRPPHHHDSGSELQVRIDHLLVGRSEEEARVGHRLGRIPGPGGGEVPLFRVELRAQDGPGAIARAE